jgi:hypothetical protein
MGKRGQAILIAASLLGACFVSVEASARSSAPQGCLDGPTSSRFVDIRAKGATANDQTDDTAAIQAAIDEIAGTGGTVLVPDGTYLVNTEAANHLRLKSHMTFKLSRGAILKAIPTDWGHLYSVLSIAGVSNVTVVGGTLEGERDEHLGTSGEWGMGISIGRASHITISGVTSKKMWGDGFYVEGATDVTFCSVNAEENRRQGLSIIEADGLVVTNSVFKNTRGTRPSSGIDLEPDFSSQKITNVRIQNSEFLDNAGAGILIDGGKGPVADVEIIDNAFAGSAHSIKIKHAPALSPSAICRNQQVGKKSEPFGGLSAFADLISWMRSSTALDSPSCKPLPGNDVLAVAR